MFWRRDPESNRAERICNPVHNRFAIAPRTWVTEHPVSWPGILTKKGSC